jgi:pyruvate/2-oxoglutarate dehydrogenase complex dihydrolipoamide acyltransferase (E2) component
MAPTEAGVQAPPPPSPYLAAPPDAPKSWFRRHWKLVTVGAVVALIGVSVAAGGGSKDETSADAPPATEAPASTAAPAPETTAPPATEAPTTAPPATEAPSRDIEGDEDEVDDVGAAVMDAPDLIGVSYIHIPVTNDSSKASTYMIDIAVESADGATQYKTTVAFLNDVQPGQSASAESMVAWGSEGMPGDATVRITEVDRTESF